MIASDATGLLSPKASNPLAPTSNGNGTYNPYGALTAPGFTTGGYGSGATQQAPLAVAGSSLPPASPLSPATPSGGGSGSGGGTIAAPAAPAAPAMTLDQYIKNNFLYNQTQAAQSNALSNYDANTLKGTQDTQALQSQRESQLQQTQADAGNANANNLAARGLLRSGINFQNQDKINATGAQAQNGIDNLLTNFVGAQQGGRANLVNQQQQALNTVLGQVMQQFNGGNTALITG